MVEVGMYSKTMISIRIFFAWIKHSCLVHYTQYLKKITISLKKSWIFGSIVGSKLEFPVRSKPLEPEINPLISMS